MKKVLFVCLAFSLSLLTTKTNAQIKIGSFDEESVLGLVPGLQQKVDAELQKFVADSLKPEYDAELEMLQMNDSLLNKDSLTKSESWKKTIKTQIANSRYKLQNWQQYQNQRLQAKQDEVLFPDKQRIYKALDEIIKDQKYTHVMKSDVFLLAPPLDNLSIKVAQKLKLPLPKDVEDAIKAAQGQGGGNQGGNNKPPAKTTPPTKKP
jgi:Skp family chaperone for outer membrane proteins